MIKVRGGGSAEAARTAETVRRRASGALSYFPCGSRYLLPFLSCSACLRLLQCIEFDTTPRAKQWLTKRERLLPSTMPSKQVRFADSRSTSKRLTRSRSERSQCETGARDAGHRSEEAGARNARQQEPSVEHSKSNCHTSLSCKPSRCRQGAIPLIVMAHVPCLTVATEKHLATALKHCTTTQPSPAVPPQQTST